MQNSKYSRKFCGFRVATRMTYLYLLEAAFFRGGFEEGVWVAGGCHGVVQSCARTYSLALSPIMASATRFISSIVDSRRNAGLDHTKFTFT